MKKTIQKRKQNLEKKISKEAKSNPKQYYAYINGNKKQRSKIGPLRVVVEGEEEVVVEPKKEACILNDFYTSVFSRCDDDGPKLQKPEERGTLSDIIFDKECIISTRTDIKS